MTRRLYKCISFTKEYWAYIAKEGTIRFASIPELWQGNDAEEFKHVWDSNSRVFTTMRHHLEPIYDKLFSKAAVLCLSKTPNKRSWEEFCLEGGVRYEFEYDESHKKNSEVLCNDVVYSDQKEFRLSNFLLARITDPKIIEILKVATNLYNLPTPDKYYFMAWMKGQEINEISYSHVVDEIVFKKLQLYKYEDEYRFIHLTEPISKALKIDLRQQKIACNKIGLKLVRIATSNVEKAKAEISNCDVEIGEVDFSD